MPHKLLGSVQKSTAIAMNTTIYVDVLFFINLIINYIILSATAIISGREHLKLRAMSAAALGAIYSVLIFFPNVDFLFWNVMKLLVSALIILISFDFKNVIAYLKVFACFYTVTMIFGGGMFAFYYLTAIGAQMNYSNGVYYIDLPLWLIIALSVLFYGFIKLIVRITDNRRKATGYRDIEIECLDEKVAVRALLDTGNSLYDPITLTPVMLVELDLFANILGEELTCAIRSGRPDILASLPPRQSKLSLRIIPYKDIATSNNIIFAFKPTRIIFSDKKTAAPTTLVGFVNKPLSSDNSYNALLHSTA